MSAFIGSREHKDLFCRFFSDTHDPYRADKLPWPTLPDEARQQLQGLPIWTEAVKIETATAAVATAMAETQRDSELADAIGLLGYEEARHATLLKVLTQRYGIAVPEFAPAPPRDPRWAFMRMGYGECFDSFFAFGLFALARDSGLFPAELATLFETVMQEEARHIILYVNWVAYTQAHLGLMRRAGYVFRRGLAVWVQLVSRMRTAMRIKSQASGSEKNFTLRAHEALGHIAPRDFIMLCLAENERRLRHYDERLLRPTFVPRVALTVLRTLPGIAAARPIHQLDDGTSASRP
jgi:hypothetical protein